MEDKPLCGRLVPDVSIRAIDFDIFWKEKNA